jgi:hypothetical protein
MGNERSYAMAATHIYHGDGVVLDGTTGYAASATAATGKLTAGVAVEEVDNSAGAAGATRITVKRGVFGFPMLGGDVATIANIGDLMYWTGNAQVGITATSRSAAGTLEFIEGGLAYVRVGF